ncbi:MAG TPA: peptidase MA family metallohydrolase [Candidatus Limnocylindrales bacterium]|nr:peptidase MA family metallohydrolase [Candidatus Limnocylindrales bacterium]
MGPLSVSRGRRTGVLVVVAIWALLGASASVAVAADPVTFGDPAATSKFGEAIEFKQPVTINGTPQRVEILIDTPGSIGPSVQTVPEGASAGASTLDYRLDLTGGSVVPNTTFTARWRVTDESGRTWLGPSIRHTYADDRFDWKTLNGDVVRVHWVEGDQAFGKRALKIGDDAVAATAKLLGVTESEPIDFFIYADQQSFYDALGPATRESVGGQAHPDIRTLFALITPDEINASWVESVVPHELTHVVFQTAVDNPYHDPPHWLNEGLAVYLSDGYGDFDRSQVKQAAADGSIIPLDGLAGAFPTTTDRFFLAYAESVSAVDRMVRIDGRDALVKLIRSYHDGVSDDEAFRAALGSDVAGFEADWLAELGASPPTRLGPRPAPVGPLPSGWNGPQPNPSFEIVGSQPPVTPGAPVPGPRGGGSDAISFLVAPLATIGLVVIVVILAVGLRRLGRRPDPRTWAETGDNRLFWRPPTGEPPADDTAPPSRLWSSTDWSLPRDPAETVDTARPDLDPSRGDTPGDRAAPEMLAAEPGDVSTPTDRDGTQESSASGDPSTGT